MDRPNATRFAKWTVRLLDIIVILIGSYGLIAWFGDKIIPPGEYWPMSGKIMQSNESIGLLVAGIGLLIAGLPLQRLPSRIIPTICALIVLTIGILTLSGHLFGFDLGMDEILTGSTQIRMGVPNAINMALLGTGIMSLTWNRHLLASQMGLYVCIINLVPAVGYILNTDLFYGHSPMIYISWPSILAMVLSGITLILTKREARVVEALFGNRLGDIMVRRLLPAILLIPLLLGFLFINSENFNLTDSHLTIGILISAIILLLSVLSYFTRNTINRIDTLREKSELSRIKLLSELKQVQEKLTIALENGKIGIWEWRIKEETVIFDERTERIFGLEPGTFGGKFSDLESLIHEEDISHLRTAINQTLEKRQQFEVIYRIRKHDGNIFYISAKGLLNRDRLGNPDSIIGVCFDVTNMKKGTEEALFKLNEELLRSNMDLQQFAYVTSHDLQEPLRTVMSFTQLLQKKYADKLGSDGNEYIRFAVDGSQRMYDLLNGLLAYSRVHSRGSEFARVDMNEVLEKVLGNLNIRIRETNAVIIKERLPFIHADESQMIQLFQNLIENSLKFSNGIPHIRISYEQIHENLIFAVQDDGIGIETQYFEKIFRIFQRLHSTDEYKGTGIGLAICKRIAERHGGEIWVKSVLGEGSTFYFKIRQGYHI
jgi:PAS domain S-box-containing protein